MLFNFVSFSQRNFYIDSTGSDADDGSFATPWKTVAAANNFDFEPGDTVLFSGGQKFGYLQLQNNDAGLTLKSYNGVATLGGLYAYNVGDITIDGINFAGTGLINKTDGIKFYMDAGAAGDLNNIIIKNTSVRNFGGNGMLIGAWDTENGYNNVQVLNCAIYENGIDGLATYGSYDNYNHTQLYLKNVKSYRNFGRTDITNTNTGSGILIGGFDGGTIEYCESFDNGKNNRHATGGPQGIWCYNCKNLVIQNSVSHDNKAGSKMDGGGFDIDGGSQSCTIQYCYSYNNEGAGFAMFEYGSANQFYNNTIRYNISENDARRNAHGALMMWAKDTFNSIKNAYFYNNTVYVSPSATAYANYPVALYLKGSNFTNINFYNNIFYTTGTTKILSGSTRNVSFTNNDYYTTGQVANFTKGGIVKDPLFVNAGGGKDGYVLRGASPAIDAGKASESALDFVGTLVPQNNMPDIGAYESVLKAPVADAGADESLTLPANSITLDASSSSDADGTISGYNWSQLSGPSAFLINTPDAASTVVSNLVQGTYVFRVMVTDNDGIKRFDDVQVIVNPVAGSRVINVNVYGGINPYNNLAWNNWNVSAYRGAASLKYSDGTVSTVGVVLSASSGVSDNGAAYGGVMALPEVLRYTSYSASTRTLTISGLSTTKSYNLEFYASRNSTGSSSTFSIGSLSKTIVTDNNKTSAANFTGLRTNPSGQLVFTISKTGMYNFLNGFVLTQNPGTVTAATPPKANAGPDQTTTLPVSTVSMRGSGSDVDGSIIKYAWTKTAGPSSYTISSPDSASSSFTNLAEGIYTFRLTVTDNEGLTNYDNVVVYVNAAVPTGTKLIWVNVFGGSNAYTNRAWNNWNVNASKTINGLRYSDTTISAVSAVISASSGIADNGSAYGGTMAPPEVLRYTSYSGLLRTLTIGGLSPSNTYNLELYASRGVMGNATIFTIGNSAVTTVTDSNKTNAAAFTGLVPNSSGQIVVTINKAGAYNFLNGFTLTENTPVNSVTRTQRNDAAISENMPGALQVQLYPNPAQHQFYLGVKSTAPQPLQIRIINELGSIVEVKQVAANGTAVFGEAYAPGMYYVQVTQGSRRVLVKVVKQRLK